MSAPVHSLKDLRAAPADPREFVRLKQAGARWLHDSRMPAKALGNRFHFAYNAAASFSRAALRYHGFQSANIDLVFCLAPSALGLGAEVSRLLLKCREVHDGWAFQLHGHVEESTVGALVAACEAFSTKIEALPIE